LLYHKLAKSKFTTVAIDRFSSYVYFPFIPYEYEANFSPIYEKKNKGYYVSREIFISFDHPSKTYYIPSRNGNGPS
jgi:hypothetical protein